MKVPRFLKVLTGFLICLALIRAVFNAGSLSMVDLLGEISKFEFDFSRVNHLFEDFRSGAFSSGFIGWNSDLSGFEGFVTNLRNVLVSFFDTIGSVIKGVVLALWNVLVESFRLLLEILHITAYLTGITGLAD